MRYRNTTHIVPELEYEVGTLLIVPELEYEGPVVYSGGYHCTVSSLLGAEHPDVLYCGDPFHADVVKCRKLCEWRTLLIVPELE